MSKSRPSGSEKVRKKSSTIPPKLSPLLRFGFEVLEHGLWHLDRSEVSLDMKFAILHVDQAIELFLKAKVLSAGESIYRSKSKETISLWEAFDIVMTKLKCTIPEKAELELLHDERNKIQHGTASPSAEDAAYMIERAFQFVDRFIRKEFKLELADYIATGFLDGFELNPTSHITE